MSWSQQDLSFKKLSNKRVTTSTGKGLPEEKGASALELYLPDIKTELIPGTGNTATGLNGVLYYYGPSASFGQTLVVDTSVPGNLTWFASSGYGNTTTANDGSAGSEALRLSDWVSDKYDAFGTVSGAGYEIKLFDNAGNLITKSDASNWLFDYQTGILLFNNATLSNGNPVSTSGPYKIVGWRYVGQKGTIPAYFGGSGYTTYTKGDILVGAGGTFIKLNVGSDNYVLSADSSTSSGLKWVVNSGSGSGSGISFLNNLTAGVQYFAVGTSGSLFNISSIGSTHTFNIPIAGSGATGLVSTDSQTFAGQKTFTSAIIGDLTGTATTAGLATTANYSNQSGYAITSGSATTATYAHQSGYAITSGLASTATYAHQSGYAITSGSSSTATTASYAHQSGYATTSGSSNTSGYATTSGLATTSQNVNIVSANTGTFYPLFTSNSSTSSGAAVSIDGSDISYNFATNTLTAGTFSGNVSATAVTATNIYGTLVGNLTGSATTSQNVNIVSTTTGTFFPLFSNTSSTAFGIGISVDNAISYDAATDTLTTGKFSGLASGIAATFTNFYGSLTGLATTATIAQGVLSSITAQAIDLNIGLISGTALSYNSNLYYNPASGRLAAVSYTGSWAGSTITGLYGGTGYTAYTKGDILVGAGGTFIKLGVGSDNTVLTASSSSATGLTWSPTANTGITTLNTLTAATQFFSTGTSGSAFNISSSGSTHTFNIPIAGTGATGLVSTLAQTFAGAKTFTGNVVITSSTASTYMASGALTVNGGVGISGQLSVNQVAMGYTGIATNPVMSFIGSTNAAPITMTVLSDGSLLYEGSSGKLFGINNNLSSGWIFNVGDISGLPIIRANANGTIAMAEFAANVGIGLSNPSYKLHVAGDTNLSSTYVYRINGTSVLSSTQVLGLTVNSGNITSGTWSGTAISVPSGGTGLTTYTVGDILYASGSATIGRLTAGTAGSILISAGAGATPYYSNPALLVSGNATTASNINIVATTTGTLYPLFSNIPTTASGVGVSVDSAISYNASTDTLTAGKFSGLASGTAATFTNIYGTLSGFATTATNVNSVSTTATNATHYLMFSPVNGGSGVALSSGVGVTFNPSSGQLGLGTGSALINGLLLGTSSNTITTASGNLTLNASGGTVLVAGNLNVQGTATYIDSTTQTITDPVIVLGSGAGGTHTNVTDTQDRGIEFRRFSGSAITGFFGLSNASGRFTFIPNANVTANNTYTGSIGVIEANITGSAITATNFYGTFVGNAASATTAGLATTAQNLNITTTATGTLYPLFTSASTTASGVAVSVDGTDISYDAATNTLTAGKFSGLASGTAATFTNFYGTLTGNVTGTSTTSQNVNIVSATTGTFYPLFSNISSTASGVAISVDSGLSWNSATDTLTSGTFSGNLSATAATATNFYGTFVGSATTSTSLSVVLAATNASHQVLFTPASGTASGVAVSTENSFVYNPSTDILSVSGLAVTSTTASTNSSTGALVVTGGVGIGQSVNISGRVGIGTNLLNAALNIQVPSTTTSGVILRGNGSQTSDAITYFSASGATQFAADANGRVRLTGMDGIWSNKVQQNIFDVSDGRINFNLTTWQYSSIYWVTAGSTIGQASNQLQISNNGTTSITGVGVLANGWSTSGGNRAFGIVSPSGSERTYFNGYGNLVINPNNPNPLHDAWNQMHLLSMDISGTANTYIGNIILGKVEGTERFSVGPFGNTRITVGSATTATGLIVKAVASQSGNIIETQASTGLTNFYVSPTGGGSFSDNLEIRSAKEVRFNNSGNTFYTGFKAGANASNTTYTLPIAFPGSGTSVLQSDNSGILSWVGVVGSASTAQNINIVAANTNSAHQLVFTPTSGSGSGVAVSSRTTLNFNPSTDILSVSGLAVTASTTSTSSSTGALIVNGGVGIGGSLFTSTSFADSISGVVLNNGVITSGSWSGSTITAFYGGTGYNSYTKGDILVGAGSTFIKLNVGTDNYVLTANSSSATGLTWSPTSATGITSLNSLTATQQYFSTGTSGSGFNISSTGSTHTFNIPNAGSGVTGLITGIAQTIAGQKTFTSAIIGDLTGTATTAGFATTANYAYQSGYGLTSGFATTTANLNISNASTGIFYPVLSNTASSTSGIGASVNSFFSFNAATGAFGATSVNILAGQSYSIGGNSVLSATSLGIGVTNSSLTALGTITTGTWAGSTITGLYGGTGYNSYNSGDILVGAGSTFIKVGLGFTNYILSANSSLYPAGVGWTWVSAVGVGTNPPVNEHDSDLWWNSNDGSLNFYYNDGDTSQWVEIAGGSGIDLSQPVYITSGAASTNTITGALIVDGGVGVGGTVYASSFSINGVYDQISSTLTTSNTNTNQVALSIDASSFRTAKMFVQVTSGSNYHSQEILMVHDDSQVYMTEYAMVNTGAIGSTFDGDISGGNMRFLVTPTNAVTTYKIACSVMRI